MTEQAQVAVGVPDGLALVPAELTAENGAKSALIGEFSFIAEAPCPDCDHGQMGNGDDCGECGGGGTVNESIDVPWTAIKEIHREVVRLFAAAPQLPGGEASDARDAARYRYWRDNHGCTGLSFRNARDIDSAIDAAMAKEQR